MNELYEAENRLDDPQVGRFWQVDELVTVDEEWSLYLFASNSPVQFNDPTCITASKGPDPDQPTGKLRENKTMETVVVKTLGIKARQKLYWAMKKRGISLETLADYRLRNWLMDYEKREQFMDRVHQMTREGDMAFLGAAYEIGTWLIPWGKAVQGVKWIVKLAKLKKATGVLKWKKFGALEKIIDEGAGVLNELSAKFKPIAESAQKMIQGGE